MAIKRYAGDKFTGLSTDTKPSTVIEGAVFYELDTGELFYYYDGSWSGVSYSADGHSHTLSDITDSGTAAAANTGTGSSNVPTVADADGRYGRLSNDNVWSGLNTFERDSDTQFELQRAGTGHRYAFQTLSNNDLRLRAINSTGESFDTLRLNTGGDFGVGINPSEKLEVDGNAQVNGQIYQEYTPHTLTDVTTTSQTRTLDVANGPVQTIEAASGVGIGFTLDATGPAEKAATVRLFVHNSSGGSTNIVGGANVVGSIGAISDNTTELIEFFWDGSNAWAYPSQVVGNGDLRPT